MVTLALFGPLAAVDWRSPLLWGIVIGWVMSVVLHEFAHGVVAYFGGDYTIKERGGLTLNPFQYIDPLMSIALPILFLMMGGIPLPGGVTYVHTSLLRNRAWETAVALAGPAMNGLLLLIICCLTHPALGLFDLSKPVVEWTNPQIFGGAMAVTQAFAVVLNLIPCPPLDGFNAVSPYLPEDLVHRLRTPPLNFLCLAGFVIIIARLPFVLEFTSRLMAVCLSVVGRPPEMADSFIHAFRLALYGNP